jgi:uncharacterized protein YjiS (DUF1127 family)
LEIYVSKPLNSPSESAMLHCNKTFNFHLLQRFTMMNVERRAAAHLPGAGVWLERGAGLARGVAGVARGTGRWLLRGLAALERTQARRLALRELYALDDRMLQDIGLRREQVGSTVNAMFRGKPVAETTQPSRQVDTGGSGDVTELDTSNDRHYDSAA